MKEKTLEELKEEIQRLRLDAEYQRGYLAGMQDAQKIIRDTLDAGKKEKEKK